MTCHCYCVMPHTSRRDCVSPARPRPRRTKHSGARRQIFRRRPNGLPKARTMQTTDRSEFARALTVMAEIFGFTLTAEQLEVWWRLFATWTLAEFRSAADHLLAHSKFMPRPADFQSLRNQAGQRTAGEAWAEVLAFVRSGGYCGGCRLGDELTHRAVLALGGYEAVAMSPTERTPFLERRFAEHYATMRSEE